MDWTKHFYTCVALVACGGTLNAEVEAILGGDQTKTLKPFAAFSDWEGTPFKIGLTSVKGVVHSVDLIPSGYALIGGGLQGDTIPFAGIVTPNGDVQYITMTQDGFIESVAMNDRRYAVLGGTDGGGNQFVGLVFPSRQLAPINTLSAGSILDVAINNSNLTLVGGLDTTGNYLARITFDGNVAPLGNLSGTGQINSVSLNDHGFGIAGGFDLPAPSTHIPFAAFVQPNNPNVVPINLTPFIPGEGEIQSVAINPSEFAIIGGFNGSSSAHSAFAALISPAGVVTPLSDLPAPDGIIRSVDINTNGFAIIGGEDGPDGAAAAFAAFVDPNGDVREIGRMPQIDASILSVAISDTQVGIVGGTSGSAPFAALVAPNGAITPIRGLVSPGSIQSVDINDIDPDSIGPFSGAANALLAGSTALGNHLMSQKFAWFEKARHIDPTIGECCPCRTYESNAPLAFWAAPFYNFARHKKHGSFLNYIEQTGGVFAAFEGQYNGVGLWGAGAGYSYSYLEYPRKRGHAHINEEMAALYTAYQWDYVYANASLWGAHYKVDNDRYTLVLREPVIKSNAKFKGWLLSPHLEIAVAPYRNPNWTWLVMEGFLMFDWANNWQDSFQETGKAGFNLVMPSIHDSLLRSETGIRFYEFFVYSWGQIFFEEKISYINRAGFNCGPRKTIYEGSSTPFPIHVGLRTPENLLGLQLHASAFLFDPKSSYISFDFQQEMGASFDLYFVELEFGKRF